jgi:hypothetical protein
MRLILEKKWHDGWDHDLNELDLSLFNTYKHLILFWIKLYYFKQDSCR